MCNICQYIEHIGCKLKVHTLHHHASAVAGGSEFETDLSLRQIWVDLSRGSAQVRGAASAVSTVCSRATRVQPVCSRVPWHLVWAPSVHPVQVPGYPVTWYLVCRGVSTRAPSTMKSLARSQWLLGMQLQPIKQAQPLEPLALSKGFCAS